MVFKLNFLQAERQRNFLPTLGKGRKGGRGVWCLKNAASVGMATRKTTRDSPSLNPPSCTHIQLVAIRHIFFFFELVNFRC